MRGKAILEAVEGVTKKWAKQRKAEERDASARMNRRNAMLRKVRRVTIKDAVWQILPEAWGKASGDGTLPASARQIFYAARPAILAMTDKDKFDYGYFAQTLLPEFVRTNGVDWDVIYDARGNFNEPHTGLTVPLGTLQVRKYLEKVEHHLQPTGLPLIAIDTEFPTVGPKNRYGAILFIEKEGFEPHFEAAKIAERFDIGIMSTKGMSVTAARSLAENLCSKYDIPLLVMHDFDVSGFTIGGTMEHDTTRYQFQRGFRVIDIGLRLEDAEELEAEDVFFPEKTDLASVAATLRKYGASDAEIEFLLRRRQRVELNAMTSPQFIAHVERKLIENGIGKIIPDKETLKIAAKRAAMIARMQKAIDAVVLDGADETAIPDDIEHELRKRLEAAPQRTWDDLLVEIMNGKR
ncbi:hypothetical protein [Phyllobacterium pellucidum]|uniref:hypothetical protein n=1 Tax=Phyllobacterium pellucidum TaxID=2740464 RepID=UPI001D13A851|nr:hypothetical protein [Phyllobacterium sp. T1018]UGY08591.1 hypothetical protein LLE51_011100 [Phyllobacterium sp. T1018]